MDGSFSFVLHSHLPYVRGAGRWPHGEEWVHEAMLGTYLPLLVALHDLRDQRVPFRMTIGLTPALLEQLADRELALRFIEYADDQIRRADTDASFLAEEGQAHRAFLAARYRERYRALLAAYVDRFGRDVPGAFGSLARSGELEIFWSSATHGYSPLLDEASIDSQLSVGRATTRRILGFDPGGGFWLPECAYRPGLEAALERHGVSHFIVDPALVAGRSTATAASVRARRSGGGVAVAPEPFGDGMEPLFLHSHSVSSGGADPLLPHLIGESHVVAVARHAEISSQVWSASLGYPGDPAYREFHRKDARSGLRYWRVTGAEVDLGEKAEYDFEAASARVRGHADHFARSVEELLAKRREPGLVVAAFDSELFGHWWFEGVEWLALVLRRLAEIDVPTTTVAGWLRQRPPATHVALAEGSWGADNDHSTWMNADTAWTHEEVAGMVFRIRATAADPPPPGLRSRAARQAVRELLLAEASDWPFLITTGQAREYASQRFRTHADRFTRLIELARTAGPDDEPEIAKLEHADRVFAEATLAPFAR